MIVSAKYNPIILNENGEILPIDERFQFSNLNLFNKIKNRARTKPIINNNNQNTTAVNNANTKRNGIGNRLRSMFNFKSRKKLPENQPKQNQIKPAAATPSEQQVEKKELTEEEIQKLRAEKVRLDVNRHNTTAEISKLKTSQMQINIGEKSKKPVFIVDKQQLSKEQAEQRKTEIINTLNMLEPKLQKIKQRIAEIDSLLPAEAA